MKHTKYILLSISCLIMLTSCWGDKTDSQQEIIPESIETNVEIVENEANIEFENTEATEVDQSGLENIEETVSYNLYEWDLSYGTDEKILFFYSADDSESVQIDENLSTETALVTFSDIFRVDMKWNAALAEQYEITEPNTFILIDEDGNMIIKTNGASSSRDLLKLYD